MGFVTVGLPQNFIFRNVASSLRIERHQAIIYIFPLLSFPHHLLHPFVEKYTTVQRHWYRVSVCPFTVVIILHVIFWRKHGDWFTAGIHDVERL